MSGPVSATKSALIRSAALRVVIKSLKQHADVIVPADFSSTPETQYVKVSKLLAAGLLIASRPTVVDIRIAICENREKFKNMIFNRLKK